jgi:O-antigen ligase
MTSLAYAALWVFVLLVPSEELIGLTSLGAPARLMGIPALALALLTTVISGKIRRWHPFHVAALLFVICAGANLLVFHMGEQLPRKFLTFIQLLLVLWMIWELAPARQRLLGLLTAYVFGAHAAALGTILLYRREAGLTRFSVAGGDANDLAMTLALALPMAWYLGMNHHRGLVRWVCRAYLPIGVFAIGLTASRGGMLAGMVALMIVPLTMTKLSPGKLAMAIALLVLSGSLAVAYVPDRVVERLATTGTEMEDLRLGGRYKVWKAGLDAFVRSPLLGYGTSSFKAVVAPVLGEGRVAHNSFLSVLVEQGLVGFLLYCMMIFVVVRAALTLPGLDRRFALVMLATLMTAMLPLTWEDRKQVWIVLAVVLGLTRTWAANTAPAQPHRQWAAPIARSPMNPRLRQPLAAPGRGAGRDAPE